MQRTAAGDIRRLRTDLMAKLSKLGQNRPLAIDSTPSSETTEFLTRSRQQASSSVLAPRNGGVEGSKLPQIANRRVSGSARLARNGGLARGRSDCRDLGTAFGDCVQRVSPPCVAWGTPSCSRNALGMSLAADQPIQS